MFAILTMVLAFIVIGGGLFYVIAKPSFGGYFDCAWDVDTGEILMYIDNNCISIYL